MNVIRIVLMLAVIVILSWDDVTAGAYGLLEEANGEYSQVVAE